MEIDQIEGCGNYCEANIVWTFVGTTREAISPVINSYSIP